jgi:molecular chaperone Hsp33
MNDMVKEIKLADRVVSALSENGHFRISCVKNSRTTRTAQEKHEQPIQTAYYLAKAMSATSLMAAFFKGEERVSIEINGNGIISRLFAEAMSLGEVRGYVDIDAEKYQHQANDASDYLGIGLLRVSRVLYDKPEPIVGVVELQHGDISSDLAYYYQSSEQVPTAVLLDCDFDENGIIRDSAGLMVQAMPGATEEEIAELVSELQKVESLTKYLRDELTPDKIIKEIVPFDVTILKSNRVDFFCRCSKDRFINKMHTLDIEEIKDMQKTGQDELVCRYCNTKYKMDNSDFETLISEIQAQKN